MTPSAAAIALIKRNEGCRLTAYRDIVGKLTIGFGDTLDVGEGMTITQGQAEDRLQRRLAEEFTPGVLSAIQGAPVTQSQFDAMVSLAWNIGVGAFAGSSVVRYHRAGDYARAADAFRLWNKAGGMTLEALVRRREEERALYLSEASAAVNASQQAASPAPAPADDDADDIDLDLLADLMRAVQRVVGTEPDGVFGPKTAAAITQAQKAA